MTAAIPPLPSSQDAALEVLNALPCGVVVIDRERRIRVINDAFRRGLRLVGEEWPTACDAQSFECRRSPHLGRGAAPTGSRCAACELRTVAVRALDGDRTVTTAADLEMERGAGRERVTIDVTAVPLRLAGDDLAVLIVNGMRQHAGRSRREAPGELDGIVGDDPALLEMLELVRQVAVMDVPVLIQGESGTGKELVALTLHSLSTRSDRMMVPVNCGALPDGLLESELFGHVKGAFTGAVRDKKGRFELADGGTIFLDEIGELGPAMQVKFLRVLQDGGFERVGGERTVRVDARLVCATNRDLAAEVEAGRFRADLYFRLCVVPITVPPLRDRPADIVPLAEHFMRRTGGRVGAATGAARLSRGAVDALRRHRWPGNVRELENAIRFALIRARDGVVRPSDLPPSVLVGSAHDGPGRVRQSRSGLTVASVREALGQAGGNRSRAARLLGVSRATLYRFLDAHEVV